MIADPDTDPSTFNFVLERIMGVIYGAESDRPDGPQSDRGNANDS